MAEKAEKTKKLEEEASKAEVKALKQDVAALRSDLKQLISSVNTTGRTKVQDAKVRIEDAKNRLWASTKALETQVADQFHDAYENVVDHGQKAITKGREKIEKRPFATVAGALVTGLLLGKFLKRK